MKALETAAEKRCVANRARYLTQAEVMDALKIKSRTTFGNMVKRGEYPKAVNDEAPKNKKYCPLKHEQYMRGEWVLSNSDKLSLISS